jgi:hypothetical protein
MYFCSGKQVNAEKIVNPRPRAALRQAKREGGQILILSPMNGSAAALSALPFDKTFAVNKNSIFSAVKKTFFMHALGNPKLFMYFSSVNKTFFVACA